MTETKSADTKANTKADDPDETWIVYRSGTTEPDENGNTSPKFSRVTTDEYAKLERKGKV